MKKILIFCILISFNKHIIAQEESGLEDIPSNTAKTIQEENENSKLQKPITRPKTTNPGIPNESSSYIVDPDNLDVLNPNRESIKEDEEPILEDIKQVLDAPKAQEKVPEQEILKDEDLVEKKTEVNTEESENTSKIKKQGSLKRSRDGLKVKPKLTQKKESKPLSQKIQKKSKQKSYVEEEKSKYNIDVQNLHSDDPDLKLEKSFNSIYKTYNINPTSIDAWEAATAKQEKREYVVQKGDTLWSISQILFGDPSFWPKIWALNKQGILNPHFILPNSKIYFYMGDAESAPTLSVGEQPKIEGVAGDGKSSDDENGEQVSENQSDDNDDKESVSATDSHKIKTSRSAPLPKSLPLYRSDEYFGKKIKEDIRINLGDRPTFQYENLNEIFITDKPIKTNVLINLDETSKLRCFDGRIIKDIKFSGELIEEYDIFEPMFSFETSVGTMYPYRYYGKAKPHQQQNLKLFECSGIIATNLVLIPKGTIQDWQNNKISTTEEATLIGGIEVMTQKLFIANQLAFVDFGSFSFEAGQVFKTMSRVTDAINGQIKILEKYGSFGVVIITDINDTLEAGDKIILNEEPMGSL